MNGSESSWPFNEPKNLAVFSIRQIIFDQKPILFVTHDEDGDWQFLGTETPLASDAVIVSLAEIVELDSSIKMLSGLQAGWEAWRSNRNDGWKKQKIAD
jgi:hypothetical protein